MRARKKKAQISAYLDQDVMKLLSDYAARRDLSQSLVVEAAIASFLSPDADERREAAITKRLDALFSARGAKQEKRMTEVVVLHAATLQHAYQLPS